MGFLPPVPTGLLAALRRPPVLAGLAVLTVLAVTLTAVLTGWFAATDPPVAQRRADAPGKTTTADAPSPRATTARPTARPSDKATLRPVPPASGVSALPKPGSGAVFGFWQAGGADIRGVEARGKMRFGAVHRYRDFDGTALWPSTEEVKLAAEGRMVHVSWEAMSYSGRHDGSLQPAPAVSARDAHSGGTRKLWTYRQITSGSLDRYLDTIADRVKAARHPFLLDFNHEADDLPDVGGSNSQRKAAGTRQEYAAAYRHIVDRFRARGVTNVTWGWTVSGWYAGDRSKWWSYQQMWPGKGYVDVILWDPYNATASRWRSFHTIASRMYAALDAGMLDKVDPSAKHLRRGLGEFGSVADRRRPAWLRAIPSDMKRLPKLVYVNYYSSGSWGALHEDDAAMRALASTVNSPYFRR